MTVKTIFHDDFKFLDKEKWRVEDMLPLSDGHTGNAAQWQVNVFGIDQDGNEGPGKLVLGKRHGIFYSKHFDKTTSFGPEGLTMRGYRSDELDLSIKDSHHPYTDKKSGKIADFRRKIYASWLSTFALHYRDGANRPSNLPDTNKHFSYRYGVLRCVVNFEKASKGDGFRFSIWLMPTVTVEDENTALTGTTYDGNSKMGLEIDLIEHETFKDTEQLLLMKVIGGNTPGVAPVNMSDHGINLMKGDHVLEVSWKQGELIWSVDGVETHRDTRDVPEVGMGIYLTREGNSGIGIGGGMTPDAPRLQHDSGLYGGNIGTLTDAEINNSEYVVRSVSVIQDDTLPGAWVCSAWRDQATHTSPTPEKTMPELTDASQAQPIVLGNSLTWPQINQFGFYDVKRNNNEYVASVKTEQFSLIGEPAGTYYVTSTPPNGDFIDSLKVEYAPGKKTPAPIITPQPERSAVEDAFNNVEDAMQRLAALLKI